jgi:hypothetical protein
MASSATETPPPFGAAAPASPQGILRWLPGVHLAPLPGRLAAKGLVAGLVLTAILIPAGMAYSVAAGLPPIYGLYATIVPDRLRDLRPETASWCSVPTLPWLR